MKMNFKKIAASVSAALLCSIPMVSNLSASAVTMNDTVSYYFGDVTGPNDRSDGEVTVEDAQQVLVWATRGETLDPVDVERADVNGDGRVSAADAQLILIYYTETKVSHKKILGDVNSDGKFTSADLVHLNRYIAGTLSDIDLIRADVNRDGVINTHDRKLLAKYLAGYRDVFDVRYGDVDSDGYVGVFDSRKLGRFVSGDVTARFSDAEMRRADVNYDGNVDTKDLTLLIRYTQCRYFPD